MRVMTVLKSSDSSKTQNDEISSFTFELLSEMGKVNVQIYTFTENVQKSPVKYLKTLGAWQTTCKDVVSDSP